MGESFQDYRKISQVLEYPKFVTSIFMRCIYVSAAVIILKVKNCFQLSTHFTE